MNNQIIKIPPLFFEKASICYLIAPFLVFCLGFLKIYIGIPIVLICSISIWRLWKTKDLPTFINSSKKEILVYVVICVVWVFLSGIGGWAFQNADFYARNAIFRDLINYDWPVFYSRLGGVNVPDSTYSLVYYFGFWLIPALFGKLFGWIAANIVLFIFALMGVGFTGILLAKSIKTSIVNSIFLLIFFSGMDIVGAYFNQRVWSSNYPTLWPPISHLEWWQTFQYSSFTTQLFWVFNQAIPTWLCTVIIVNQNNFRKTFLLWGLCLFYGPIPSLGLAVIVFAQILNRLLIRDSMGSVNIKEKGVIFFREILSVENFIGAGLCLVMMLFFSANASSSSIKFIHLPSLMILMIVIFSILEWLLFWIVVQRKRYEDIGWYFIGFVLILSLVIKIAETDNISFRATIAPLFLLMIWVGQIFFHERTRSRIAILLLLFFGAFTPMYEINRSIYRTVDYYVYPTENLAQSVDICSNTPLKPAAFLDQPEKDHPGTLIADDRCTVSNFDLEYRGLYIADTSKSIFFRYLARK